MSGATIIRIRNGERLSLRSGVVRGSGPRGPQGDIGPTGPDGPEGPQGPPGSINDFFTELTDTAATATNDTGWVPVLMANVGTNELLADPVVPGSFAFTSAGFVLLASRFQFEEKAGGGSTGARRIRLVDDQATVIDRTQEEAVFNAPTIVPLTTIFEADPARTYHFEAMSDDAANIDITDRRAAMVRTGSGPAGVGVSYIAEATHTAALSPAGYPDGLSIMEMDSTAGWPAAAGLVITWKADGGTSALQEFYQFGAGQGRWTRTWNPTTVAWGAWRAYDIPMIPSTGFDPNPGSLIRVGDYPDTWNELLSGANRLAVPFIAPQSGVVTIVYSAGIRNNDGASSAAVGTIGYAVGGVRIRHTTLAGDITYNPSATPPGNVPQGIMNPTSWYVSGSSSEVITGLVPGDVYFAIFVHRTTNPAARADYVNRRITVIPVG